MRSNGPTEPESTDSPDERTRRALDQYLTVLPAGGARRGADGLYEVVSESGRSYLVDVREGACECDDYTYREPAGGCKHLRRCLMELGERPLPDSADESDLPRDFGQHIKGADDDVVADDRPRVLADGGEFLSDEPSVDYTYHVEDPAQGGERFIRCTGCGAEILVRLGGASSLIHREGCPAGEGR